MDIEDVDYICKTVEEAKGEIKEKLIKWLESQCVFRHGDSIFFGISNDEWEKFKLNDN